MVSFPRQIVGFSLAVIGFLGSIVICALPIWRIKHSIRGIVTPPVIWEGLWMYCIWAIGHTPHCYSSSEILSQDLQAARALVIIAILFGTFGILLVIVGAKCIKCMKNEKQKCLVHIAAGVIFITSGLLVLIPVCWTTATIISIREENLQAGLLYKEGTSLFIGWGAAGLLVLGGALLCTYKKKRNFNERVRFLSLKNECEP